MRTSLIVLITGSRHYSDVARIRDVLKLLPDGTIIVHGDAAGTDTIADMVAKDLGFKCIPCPADWLKYGKAAGGIRNQYMLDTYKPTLALAFPLEDSKGTYDMINRAKKAGIQTFIY